MEYTVINNAQLDAASTPVGTAYTRGSIAPPETTRPIVSSTTGRLKRLWVEESAFSRAGQRGIDVAAERFKVHVDEPSDSSLLCISLAVLVHVVDSLHHLLAKRMTTDLLDFLRSFGFEEEAIGTSLLRIHRSRIS